MFENTLETPTVKGLNGNQRTAAKVTRTSAVSVSPWCNYHLLGRPHGTAGADIET